MVVRLVCSSTSRQLYQKDLQNDEELNMLWPSFLSFPSVGPSTRGRAVLLTLVLLRTASLAIGRLGSGFDLCLSDSAALHIDGTF